MQTRLIYSLKKALENELELPSIIIYDGVRLPKNKPFTTVQQMSNNNNILSKQRETVSTTYGFRVALYEETSSSRMVGQERISDLFLFNNLPLYNVDGTLSDRVFEVEVEAEVPLDASDLTDDTNAHRVYFEIYILNTRHKNRGRK